MSSQKPSVLQPQCNRNHYCDKRSVRGKSGSNGKRCLLCRLGGRNADHFYVNNNGVGDATASISVETSLLLPHSASPQAAESAPSGIGKTNETIDGKEDGTLTGVNNTMEYRKDGETDHTRLPPPRWRIWRMAPIVSAMREMLTTMLLLILLRL